MKFSCVLLCAVLAAAQGFEAVSVRPVAGGRSGMGALRGGPGTSSPGQITGVATMRALVMRAYGLKEYQVLGPGWMDSSRYEIVAKVPAGAAKEQMGPMLEALLRDRFGLAAHRETRELPAYELTVAKGGAKVKAAADGETVTEDAQLRGSPRFVKGGDGLPAPAPGAQLPRTYSIVLSGPDGLVYKVWGRRETMEQLADRLSTQLDRPVVDATKLWGAYDFALSWWVESAGGVVPRTGPPPDQIETTSTPLMTASGVSIYAALEKQLGLRLEQKRLPIEVLVVDRANAKPTEN